MIRITTETLRDRKCREDTIKTFNNLFPKGLTLKSEQEAVEVAVKVDSEFVWDLASHRFLNVAGHKEYKKVVAPASEEHEKAIHAASAEYNKVADLAWAERDKAIAAAFARAFWKQEVGE